MVTGTKMLKTKTDCNNNNNNKESISANCSGAGAGRQELEDRGTRPGSAVVNVSVDVPAWGSSSSSALGGKRQGDARGQREVKCLSFYRSILTRCGGQVSFYLVLQDPELLQRACVPMAGKTHLQGQRCHSTPRVVGRCHAAIGHLAVAARGLARVSPAPHIRLTISGPDSPTAP